MYPSVPTSRRRFIRSAVAGSLLMPGILHELLAADSTDPLAPRAPHFPARAKSVIFLHMSGGVSHVDSFDPKPRLFADHGRQVRLDHPETRDRPGYERLFLKRPGWRFTRHGRSGIEVSELTGSFAFARPSIGAWVSFGLGTVNRNLPSFVVILLGLTVSVP